MRKRTKKLIAYMLVVWMVCQLFGIDTITSFAVELSEGADVILEENATDDYVYVSGGMKTLTINAGVTLTGNVDFSQATETSDNTLVNNGTITGNVYTGESTGVINNNGVISGSVTIKRMNQVVNKGVIGTVNMQGGDLEVYGGTVNMLNDEMGCYVVLSNCTVGTLSTVGDVVLEGDVQSTSVTAQSLQSDGNTTLQVSDYLGVASELENITTKVSENTILDATLGTGYVVQCDGKEYVIDEGKKGSIIDLFAKKVLVATPDSPHFSMSGYLADSYYLPGITIRTITLNAEEGYYFPESYCSEIQCDGKGTLKATRVSETEVSISYTLSDEEEKDVTISVGDASIKPKEPGKGTITVSDVHYGVDIEVILASDTNTTEDALLEYKEKDAPNSEYRKERPTAVGAYTVRATFKENEHYTSCSATADYNITYLPIQGDAFTIKGDKGENGYFISKVEIIPKKGYSIARKLDGNYKDSIVLTSSRDLEKVYFMKNKTGEKTDGKKISPIKIDITNPIISAQHGQIYYTEELTVDIKDSNLMQVKCNNVEVTVDDGAAQVILESNHGANIYNLYAKDKAGNNRQIRITVADEWLKTGIIPANRLVRLSQYTAYQLDGGTWKVAGDNTQYRGGQKIYVRSGGEYTFTKE
ncbi:MAG: hypothetical protein E7264_08820 [Lachnospiraceae bacterium]|nr:hypothetical protein [Lachnospiraceae bacterium]